MLLTPGARSVLCAASVAHQAAKSLDGLRLWAGAVQQPTNYGYRSSSTVR